MIFEIEEVVATVERRQLLRHHEEVVVQLDQALEVRERVRVRAVNADEEQEQESQVGFLCQEKLQINSCVSKRGSAVWSYVGC